MPAERPPSGTEGHPGFLPEDLRKTEFRQEVESLLGALRQWLLEFEECGANEDHLESNEVTPADLHSVVSELTALRGEVRLESRGSKAAREKMDQATDAFREGLESLREGASVSREHLEASLGRALAPLIRERDRLRDELKEARERPVRRILSTVFDALDSLRRGREATARAQQRLGWRGRLLPSGVFRGLLDGYDMSRRRLEALLGDLGVEEVSCEGQDFDPLAMRTVETEPRDDVPPGRVVGLVRRGYRRGGTVLRLAEVRTAVASKPSRNAPRATGSGAAGEEQEEKKGLG